LIESLCGFERSIRTLDDRNIVVSTIPGEVIKPGDIKAVPNEGMPRYKTLDKGRLIIKFFIKFPNDLSFPEKNMKILNTILPVREPLMNLEKAMQVPLEDISPESETPEQEYHGGAQRVECQTS
uniref:DnaJ C-terminal domain-containing protein n=1 Tax=Salmonella sp. s51228 TaxID=3159652 RepID=UPI00397E9F15